MTSQTDMLDDFTRREITLNQITKTVLVAGFGPGVVVMAEMPGITPHVARFARWVKDAGFRVYLPSLFGCDDGANVLQHACVSAEFRALAADKASPVTRWLRSLAQLADEECDGPEIGTIGMCFSGNFALGMMLQPSTQALASDKPDVIKSPSENSNILTYRFASDTFCQAQRFAAHRETALFTKVAATTPNSMVFTPLTDALDEPSIQARDEILTFFKQHLIAS